MKLEFVLIIATASCVLRSKFKTCEQSGFCSRVYGSKLTADRFEAKEVECDKGVISAILYDKLYSDELVFRALSLENNRVRFHVTQRSPRSPRFDLFRDGWKGVQDEPAVDHSVPIYKVNLSFCELVFSNNYRVSVDFNPLLITISGPGGKKIVTINENNALFIEPQIIPTSHADNPNETETESFARESFDGHTDSLPNGFQAVSFDATFHDFKHVYGLPEHADTFSLNTDNARYRLYNLDVFEFELYNQMALYGSVPYVVAKNDETTIGLLFLNAAEMWVNLNKVSPNPVKSFIGLNKDSITRVESRWVAESGNIDIILMLGPNPKDVSYQYALTTGFPSLPPFFAIAYHQCRWNYNDQEDVNNVHTQFDEYTIPLDVVWLDIEHTPHKKFA
ncbi:Neutral alpha-glucosidase AB [Thelohanellus kitauei]|uniref:Glucosidase II subunit alpha n=1 Tax=Thelohanellus kitauei TaxID=669202 RepID=A0A0C2N7F3_THEKT|nr:Neutral alpha-glucosidase AB [Thelohanellus kitauei]